MRVDGIASCYRCNGSCFDYVSHHKGEMKIQCCYCLAFMDVFGYPPEEPKTTEPKHTNPGSYVLKYGRHAGKSIEEIASLGERGVEYLRLLAKDSPKLRDMINEHLNESSAVS